MEEVELVHEDEEELDGHDEHPHHHLLTITHLLVHTEDASDQEHGRPAEAD